MDKILKPHHNILKGVFKMKPSNSKTKAFALTKTGGAAV